MAGISDSVEGTLSQEEVEGIKTLLWGTDIKYDIFRRWTQGVVFSEDEPSALVQFEGGPCAVIAPLQAFILKNAIFSENAAKNNWRAVSEAERDLILCHALADMLSLMSREDCVYLVEHVPPTPARGQLPVQLQRPTPGTPGLSQNTAPSPQIDSNKASEMVSHNPGSSKHPGSSCDSANQADPKKKRLSHEEFHSGLRWHKCDSCDLLRQLKLSLPNLQGEYGILLVLYSVIMTKGIEQIKNEVEDLSESLIAGAFGHGSQSLINLLITGRAVSNVWDNDKDVSGLMLQGINKQSVIGFLTQLEHLRYCEVGWYLKNPKYSIWLLGSETHLTVLFSEEKDLVVLESPEAEARRIFCRFDSEGCGFISGERLGPLMDALNLVSDPEYVKIVLEKLDPECLGIVTLNCFLEEFFASESQPDPVNKFSVLHYNGQPRSCPNGKVAYSEGQAVIEDMPELQIISDSSPIKTCLMTKWPTIDLKWKNNLIPSLC